MCESVLTILFPSMVRACVLCVVFCVGVGVCKWMYAGVIGVCVRVYVYVCVCALPCVPHLPLQQL